MPDISPARPAIHYRSSVLNSPDPPALARFYAALLGWEIVEAESDWAQIAPPGGAEPMLSFQIESIYERPTWPAAPGRQQMMQHLDFRVEDLDTALAHAIACGATIADDTSEPGLRVMYDPDGHVFCLFTH